jgi:hypothetical protein
MTCQVMTIAFSVLERLKTESKSLAAAACGRQGQDDRTGMASRSSPVHKRQAKFKLSTNGKTVVGVDGGAEAGFYSSGGDAICEVGGWCLIGR